MSSVIHAIINSVLTSMPLSTNAQLTLQVVQVAEGDEYTASTWLALTPLNFPLSIDCTTFPLGIRMVDAFNNFIGLAVVQYLHAYRPTYIDFMILLRIRHARHPISTHLLIHSVHVTLRVYQKLEQFLISVTEPAFDAGGVMHSGDDGIMEIRSGEYSYTGWSKAILHTTFTNHRAYPVLTEHYATGRLEYGSSFSMITTEGEMKRGDQIYLRRCRDGTLMSSNLVVGGRRRLDDGRIEFWTLCVETEKVYYLISMMHDCPDTLQTVLTNHVRGMILPICVGVMWYVWLYVISFAQFKVQRSILPIRKPLLPCSTQQQAYGTIC